MSYVYEYPRAALTADAVVIGVAGVELSVLLIQRLREPFAGCWALPGGFFDMEDESVEHAAVRELQEETGLRGVSLEQLHTFSRKGRDPRGRTVSVACYGVVEQAAAQPVAADDATAVRWHLLSTLPPLAFDHAEVIQKAVQALRHPEGPLNRRFPDAYAELCHPER